MGANVIGYSLDPKSTTDNFVLCNLGSIIKDYREDIRNYKKLGEIVHKEKPDIIFHLAAQPLVLQSYENPHYTMETNTLGTLNVLEAFRNAPDCKGLVVITTDKVYQNNEWLWGYREIDRLGGKDPYSASKAAAELLIASYQNSFFQNSDRHLVSVRAGNVIGGGDWSENRIIPDCIKAIEKNQKIMIRNPHSTRPWQHVLEPLGGYLLLGQQLLKNTNGLSGAWNFGPNLSNVVNVEKLVTKIIDAYGSGEYEFLTLDDSPKESNYLSLNIDKATSKLKWKPLLTLEETIQYTIGWYKNYKSTKVFEFCTSQINSYENLWKLRNGS